MIISDLFGLDSFSSVVGTLHHSSLFFESTCDFINVLYAVFIYGLFEVFLPFPKGNTPVFLFNLSLFYLRWYGGALSQKTCHQRKTLGRHAIASRTCEQNSTGSGVWGELRFSIAFHCDLGSLLNKGSFINSG